MQSHLSILVCCLSFWYHIKNIVLRPYLDCSDYFTMYHTSEHQVVEFLAVQWLRLYTFPAEDMGSIPGGETKIPQVVRHSQKKKKKKKKTSSNCTPKYTQFLFVNYMSIKLEGKEAIGTMSTNRVA